MKRKDFEVLIAGMGYWGEIAWALAMARPPKPQRRHDRGPPLVWRQWLRDRDHIKGALDRNYPDFNAPLFTIITELDIE